MPTARKSLRERYPHKLDDVGRASIYSHLKSDRMAISGRIHGYDPSLGDRPKNLRKQCANAVIRLVMNRYKAW